ncbi:MAG: bifunctional diguanylate cyclase/phosphodiesterase [Rhodoferax sp.]
MNFNYLYQRSLKTRVTLLTLAIFVVTIWALVMYASRIARADMERMVGEQQFSTVSIVAAQLNGEIESRLQALERYADGRATPELLGSAATIQQRLEHSPTLQSLFNAGLFVTDDSGTAIASIPVSAQRLGVNYMERDHVAAALREAKTTVSKPVIGKTLGVPVVSMAAPIRDGQGRVVGSVVGVTDLSQKSFLDKVSESRYGKTGGYVLAAPKHRLVVSASDKTRIMTTFPAPGVNPLFDRYLAGFEGSGRVVDTRGLEVLSAAKQVPAAGWVLVVRIPSEEAFAPIKDTQERVLWVAIFLTLLAGALIWWILRRQLSPLLAAASTLAKLSGADVPTRPLPVSRQDEIGQLISGFNRLLGNFQEQGLILRKSEGNYRRIVENSPDIVYVFSMTKGGIYYSPTVLAVLGYSVEHLLANPFMWAESISPDDRPLVADAVEALKNGTPFKIEYRIKDSKGEWHWLFDRSTSVLEEDGDVVVEGLAMDITERKAAEQQIQALAFSDPLTGLPNRRLLMDRLEQAMTAAARHGHQDAMLFIDLDDFKTLNDTLGHDKGDLLLKQIAQRLIACVREGDTVARLSGDEFVVLLENLSEDVRDAATQAQTVCGKILDALGQPYQLDGHGHHSTASIGVTLFGGTLRENIEEPLKRAELAMYQAKRAGRNTLRFFEPEMRTAVNTRATLEADLRQAVTRGQFLLYYQPQYSGGRNLVGVEALVRWQHPERGRVSPVEFIPVAETSSSFQ